MKQSKDFQIGGVVNLLTLVIGLTAGFLLGNLNRTNVNAQAIKAPAPHVVDVSPNMTIGSMGTNLVLAHEVDSDKVVVNGIDLLLFDQNLLTYLSRQPTSETADLENIVNSSRATELHRIASSPVPATPEPAKK